ncbi:MAG TPA: histidine phosphatase family protein [Candidatus Udaeobacter sp.]|jgi:probable phosphoglycerate mutase
MTQFLFVRHGAHDLLTTGVICGRQPDVHLNALGRQQAEQIAERLAALPIDAIYCSPLERACETAGPLAAKLGLPMRSAEEFNEIDVGVWTNRTVAELKDVPEWQQWNSFRSGGVAPGGESMVAVQARAVGKVSELRTRHSFVTIFTHADIIRAVLAHFLGVHLDLFLRIEIDPASASWIELYEAAVRVRLVNGNLASRELLLQR